MDDGIVRYWPKGIKEAFKFEGFCEKHDKKIFAPVNFKRQNVCRTANSHILYGPVRERTHPFGAELL